MNICDQGIILSVRKYSENSAIIKILSRNNGICSGFIRGNSKKNNLIYQIANLVEFNWNARLEDNLGFFKIELVKSFLADILSDPIRLNAITSLISIIYQNLPEKQENEWLFAAFLDLLRNLNDEVTIFLANYIKLEIDLLENLGYGIDLSKCVVTGLVDDLHFVSPKSGRAVSKSAGEKYASKLLKLPQFLSQNNIISHHAALSRADENQGFSSYQSPSKDGNWYKYDKITKNDLLNGLELSGFFIEKYLCKPANIKLPDSRFRLINLIRNGNFKV